MIWRDRKTLASQLSWTVAGFSMLLEITSGITKLIMMYLLRWVKTSVVAKDHRIHHA